MERMLAKRYPRRGRECVAIYTIAGTPHQHPYIACMLRGAVHEYLNVCCSKCLGRIVRGALWLGVLRAKPNVGSIAMPNEPRRVECGRDQMIVEDAGPGWRELCVRRVWRAGTQSQCSCNHSEMRKVHATKHSGQVLPDNHHRVVA